MAGRGLRRAAVLSMSALLLSTSAVWADDIYNNLDTSIDAAAEIMPLNVGGADGTTQLYVRMQNSDGKNGCNLTGGTALVVSVSSSNPAVATVSPSSVTFGSCGDMRTLTVTPVAAGSTTISLTQTSNSTEGSFNLSPATFIVNVAAPANPAGAKCPGYASDPRNQVVGTAGNDILNGTAGNDIICGLDGRDTIDGLAGNDLLLGGRGLDTIHGSAGDDTLRGNRGWDLLYGGPDNDTFFGGRGRDLCQQDAGTGTATSCEL